ncbi:monocarboxylate transporter 3-like isoform X1 [Haemaphysalis longicornis]
MARSEASLRADPSFGLDSPWSWVTVAFLSWVLCTGMIGYQAIGVLFYGIIETFGVNRQQASWPLVLTASLTSLAGPVMGYLCRRFSCRSVLAVSTFVAGAATCLCFYASDILFLTVMFGVMHGLALSGTFVSVNVLASQHFERRRTTACSIIFTMSGLGALFVPPLAEFFRVTYGVRGTFLLLGGLLLNACPAVIIIRSPVWMQRSPNISYIRSIELSTRTSGTSAKPLLSVLGAEEDIVSEEAQTHNRRSNRTTAAKTFFRDCSRKLFFCRTHSPPSTHAGRKQTSQPSIASVAKHFFTIAFIVNAISFSVIILGLTVFMLVSVDIATDRGVAPSSAVLLLNAFAACNIILRPVSGMVIDSRLMRLETVMIVGYFIQALAYEIFAWSSSFPMMLFGSALIGVSNGARVYLQAPLLVRDFGIDSLPLTMGATSFCVGLVGFTRPILVGYYRDHHGSYDGLLHILAAINGVLVVTWAVRLMLKTRNQ